MSHQYITSLADPFLCACSVKQMTDDTTTFNLEHGHYYNFIYNHNYIHSSLKCCSLCLFLQHETYCILLIEWLSGLRGVSKLFLVQKMGRSKKNSGLTAKSTTQPTVWHSDPRYPLDSLIWTMLTSRLWHCNMHHIILCQWLVLLNYIGYLQP